MALNYDTVAIPVVGGLNLDTPARLVDPRQLLEAENVRFPAGAGASKRRGHLSTRVRGTKVIPPGVPAPLYSGSSIPDEWVFGWGVNFDNIHRTFDQVLQTSAHPDAALLFGAASRDNETLTWDGTRLFSLPSGGQLHPTLGAAVMPALRAEPTAKFPNTPQVNPDAADNGSIRVVTWLSAESGTAYFQVQDSRTGAVFRTDELPDVVSAEQVRCLPIGDWVVILSCESALLLHCYAIHKDTPLSYTHRTLGDCDAYFDAVKVDETRFAVVRRDGDTAVLSYHDADGSNASVVTPTVVLDIGFITTLHTLALAVHPQFDAIGLAFRATVGEAALRVYARLYTTGGSPIIGRIECATCVLADRPVGIAPLWTGDDSGEPGFDVYWDDRDAFTYTTNTPDEIHMARVQATSVTPVFTRVAYWLLQASQAFRVGNRTFIWASRRSTLQSTWVLLDESLRPVGHQDYAAATAPAHSDFPWVASVNWRLDGVALKDVTNVHMALGYKVRVSAEDVSVQGNNAIPVYAEPSIKFSTLNFLPKLRSAQAGRCTYFAGAQLWCYDGRELTEAGFHFAPEDVDVSTIIAGSLTGSYRWRVDLCYRNAQNEEVRSHSFFTDEAALTADGVTLKIRTVLSRREDAYFLIYRNANAGTLWYLVNSRDPSSAAYLKNDQTLHLVTFNDDGTTSDANLATKEQHPGNAGFGYLEPIAAPACEVIAAGANRLWLAGGEIESGAVMPSRLYQPGETPSFNPGLIRVVDRSAEPITAIGHVGETTVVFRKTATYVSDDRGPENVLTNVLWTDFELAIVDIGAVSQEGLGLIDKGLVFQSPSGFRLFAGRSAAPIGGPVDDEAEDFEVEGCVVVSRDSEVRWYGRTGAFVYNYEHDLWSKWTVSAVGAVRDVATGLAILATPDGYVYREADDHWRDGDRKYRHRVRFAWLRGGELFDYQRVRRIGAMGEWDGVTPHDVHVEVFYNERDYPGQTFDWEVPTDGGNIDTFGSATFGAGFFGDTGDTFQDSEWRWRRRLQRSKCSVISVAIDDNYSDGPGFTLTALALEIGTKSGLDRVAWRGGTTNGTTISKGD